MIDSAEKLKEFTENLDWNKIEKERKAEEKLVNKLARKTYIEQVFELDTGNNGRNIWRVFVHKHDSRDFLIKSPSNKIRKIYCETAPTITGEYPLIIFEEENRFINFNMIDKSKMIISKKDKGRNEDQLWVKFWKKSGPNASYMEDFMCYNGPPSDEDLEYDVEDWASRVGGGFNTHYTYGYEFKKPPKKWILSQIGYHTRRKKDSEDMLDTLGKLL